MLLETQTQQTHNTLTHLFQRRINLHHVKPLQEETNKSCPFFNIKQLTVHKVALLNTKQEVAKGPQGVKVWLFTGEKLLC